jgi:hypothetical protein
MEPRRRKPLQQATLSPIIPGLFIDIKKCNQSVFSRLPEKGRIPACWPGDIAFLSIDRPVNLFWMVGR